MPSIFQPAKNDVDTDIFFPNYLIIFNVADMSSANVQFEMGSCWTHQPIFRDSDQFPFPSGKQSIVLSNGHTVNL